jgi:hypothetical protein
MLSDFSCAFFHITAIEPFDSVGDAGVQVLFARSRDPGK